MLQAGTNNLPGTGPGSDANIDDVVSGIRAIADEFRGHAPKATIIVTGVFPRSQNPELWPTIQTINERLQALAMERQYQFLNINDQLADATGRLLPGISSDGLHLEKPGYEIWARALKPVLEKFLGPPGSVDTSPPPTGDPRARR